MYVIHQQVQNSQMCEQRTAVGRCQVCPCRPTPTLGEPGTQDSLGYPVGSFCDQKVFPFPKGPSNADGRRLWFRLALWHCLCFPTKWKHIKFHLSDYRQKAHQIFCLTEYMFGTMWCSCLVDSFSMLPHIVRSADWSECPVHHHASSSPPLKPLQSPTTTASSTYHWHIETPFPHPHRQFSRSGQPILQGSPALIGDTIMTLSH